MKRALKLLVAVVLILAVVVLGRTIRFTSNQIRADAVPRPVVNAERAARHLSEAIRFKTISHENRSEDDPSEFVKLHDFLARSYPLAHGALSRETVNGLSLLYTWKGARPDLAPFLLMAHQDVVPVEPGTEGTWTYPPFEGEVADGHVWGRGALDDKESVIAILEAVETLVENGFRPERTLYVAFGHDEEVGGAEGAAKVAALLKSRGVELDYVLDEGGAIVENMIPGLSQPAGIVAVSEKGYLSAELSVEVVGGHSSVPPRSTAVGILSRAIVRLEENPLPGGVRGMFRETLDTLGRDMTFFSRMAMANLWLTRPLLEWRLEQSPETSASLRTTTAATVIEGGVKANVLPTRARAIVNFRIAPEDNVQKVLEHVQRVVDDARVKVMAIPGQARDPAPVSPKSGPAYERIARTIRELWPDVLVVPYVAPGGTDSRNFVPLSTNIYRFAPVRVSSDDLKRAHGTDERIATENLAQIVQFYVQLIRRSP